MRRYSKIHNAYYDERKDIWLEKACDAEDCPYCPGRPEKPSQVNLVKFNFKEKCYE